MSLLSDILAHNHDFVARKDYEAFRTDRFPDKRLVVVTCMDTRLLELLPKAMNLANGDAKILKCAGAIVAHPFGSMMRSILVAIYELHATEIAVVGHYDCGMSSLTPDRILSKAEEAGIPHSTLDTLRHSGIDLDSWLVGFNHPRDGVLQSVQTIHHHPLLPKSIPVHGLLIDPTTGKLDTLVNGYERT